MKQLLTILAILFSFTAFAASPSPSPIPARVVTSSAIAPTKTTASNPVFEKVRDKVRNRTLAAILCFFLGGLGIHRFYMGDTLIGVIQLLTAGGFGVWFIIDFVRLLLGGFKSRFE